MKRKTNIFIYNFIQDTDESYVIKEVFNLNLVSQRK